MPSFRRSSCPLFFLFGQILLRYIISRNSQRIILKWESKFPKSPCLTIISSTLSLQSAVMLCITRLSYVEASTRTQISIYYQLPWIWIQAIRSEFYQVLSKIELNQDNNHFWLIKRCLKLAFSSIESQKKVFESQPQSLLMRDHPFIFPLLTCNK